MKYSMYYYYGSRHKDKIDEISIIYREKSLRLIDFAKERPEQQRLVLDITQLSNEVIEECFEIFAEAAKMHPNIAVKMLIKQADPQYLIDNNIDFFYEKFIGTWDELNSLINAGVSDVYITNELGFHMDEVSSYCHSKNINIRVFPNVAQSIDPFDNLDMLTKFFIRPEDVKIYEEYVDYMELWGRSSDLDFCYDIYKEGKWLGLLNQIIIGYEGNELNRELSNMFGLYRTKCKKRCSYTGCSICHRFGDLSLKMGEAGLGLDYSKEDITREEYLEKIKELIKNEYKTDETNMPYDTDWTKESIN